jgi:hypothetical protein
MPVPKSNESKDTFINRCMPKLISEGKDKNQAYAVCNSMFDSRTEMEIHEMSINDYAGVESIALVEEPAIEINFMCFSSEKKAQLNMSIADKEKRIITGPVLIPEQLIYRIDKKTNKEYFVFFSEETISNIAEKFMLEKRNSEVNIEHEQPVNDISILEIWLVADPNMDKSKSLGYNVPKGSLMMSYKVNNDDVWNNLIKTGLVKGFSIEGSFIEKFATQVKDKDEILYEEIVNILNQVTE